MPRLPATLYLAQKVGKGLGASDLLFGALSTDEKEVGWC